jgi:excisionase family DNA binding protein
MIVLTLTPEELSDMIGAAIAKAMPKLAQAPAEEEFMSITEAAKFVGLVVPTLYSLVSRGEIPVCKRASRLYFSKQELTDWIKSGRKKTTAEITAEAKSYIKIRPR